MYNVVNTLAPSFLIESSFLQVRRTKFYKVLDEFQICPDPTKDCRVSCPLRSENMFYLVENYSKYFDDLLALR